jgi:hypothetical protein
MRWGVLLGIGLAAAATGLVAERFWPGGPADGGTDADVSDDAPLPLPPLPSRIAQGDRYDRCLAMVGDDPRGVEEFTAAWDPAHTDDGATQCLALARIALGDAASGAQLLQTLAESPGGRPARPAPSSMTRPRRRG